MQREIEATSANKHHEQTNTLCALHSNFTEPKDLTQLMVRKNRKLRPTFKLLFKLLYYAWQQLMTTIKICRTTRPNMSTSIN